MKINHTLVKATAAAALTLTGITAIGTVKTNTVAHVQAATFKVKINYIPGYGINIWNSPTHPHFTGVRAHHGSTWTVLATTIDKKDQTWYEIGQNQWILAKYTVNAKKAKVAKKTIKKVAKPIVKTPAKKVVKSSRQASSSASAVIALAKAQAGKRYVWGATGPSCFDCSGLTQYVYAKAAGINITRTTYTQVHQGRAVSLKSLQPGDLLFWGSAAAPYHVGIYLGNGQYIHAATPSQGVRIQTLSSYFYPSTARRILK